MTFVLEVQEYDDKEKTFLHLGYMRITFLTRKEAAVYLERYKPHHLMNAPTWKSTVDSDNVRYVVREYYGEKCDIDAF
jgi:hypothetical protein